MFRVSMGFISCALLFSACSSQRKLSQFETRAPAGTHNTAAISPLREKLMANHSLPKTCPVEIRELLSTLVDERVKFPPCPERLQMEFETARSTLRMDESSALEELLNGQCRVLGREGNEDSLEALLQGTEPGFLSRGKPGAVERPALDEKDMKLRLALREGLLEVKNSISPIEQWVRSNGDFVIPEEQLEFISQIVNRKNCRMKDEEVDLSYRIIHSLEELVKIESESEPQRARVARFLSGIHSVIDRKIQEFFRP